MIHFQAEIKMEPGMDDWQNFYEKRQVNRMDSCDSHGRTKNIGLDMSNSLFCFF